jgi:2-dehydropantoate 2-reductase
MRILVHGAGAVGGYFGALLARGGHEVWFVARGENLSTLRERGLVVELGSETLRLPAVHVVSEPREAPRPELVLVCVKSYDTPAAAAALRPLVGPDTIVLSLQNGVENEDILARGLGIGPPMVALTRIGVERVAPGRIVYSGRGTIVYGEPGGSESARARRAGEAFAAAGVPYQLRTDILVAAWEKLSWNAGFNAVTALTRSTVAEVMSMAATRELIVSAMEEVDATAIAGGIPVRRTRTQAVLDDSVNGLPDFQTSMLQDVLRGRRLEHDAINGAVVRAASRLGVPVPVNRTLLALLERLDPARRRA